MYQIHKVVLRQPSRASYRCQAVRYKQSKIFVILRKKSRLTPNAWNYDAICICHVSRPPRLSVTQATMFLAWEIHYGVFRNPMKIKLDSPKEISTP